MHCLGACAVERRFENHLRTSGGGFVVVYRQLCKERRHRRREEVKEAGRARRRAAVVLSWRTVPPAAWLRANPSVGVSALVWMVQVGPAGGDERCTTAYERPRCTG